MQLESTAIVFHKLNTGMHASALSVVTHELRSGTNGPSLGPGRVFSTADKMALAQSLVDDLSAHVELLDERCLVANLETLMWYRPRQKTTVCVAGLEYSVPLPSLVFLCHRGKLYVRAYKGAGRPNGETLLLSAGLPNLYQSGSWCAGGNLLPSHPTQRDIERIEHLFFESPFTHPGSEPMPHGCKDMTEWFCALQSKRSFPMKSLPTSSQTLGRWLQGVVGGHF